MCDGFRLVPFAMLPYEEPLRQSVRGLEDVVMLQHNTSVIFVSPQIRNMCLYEVRCWTEKTSLHQWEFLNNWLVERWMSRNLWLSSLQYGLSRLNESTVAENTEIVFFWLFFFHLPNQPKTLNGWLCETWFLVCLFPTCLNSMTARYFALKSPVKSPLSSGWKRH